MKPQQSIAQTSLIAPALILDCITHHFLKCTPVTNCKTWPICSKHSKMKQTNVSYSGVAVTCYTASTALHDKFLHHPHYIKSNEKTISLHKFGSRLYALELLTNGGQNQKGKFKNLPTFMSIVHEFSSLLSNLHLTWTWKKSLDINDNTINQKILAHKLILD